MQALWMLLGAFFFAAMAVCVKIASAWFNSAELVCYRGLISMLLLWGLARHQKLTLATRYPAMHAWRSLLGVVSLGTWFYAIAGLPLATAMTLNYMSSIWIAAFLLGAALLTWHPAAGPSPLLRQGPITLSVLVGFVGVVLTLRPTMGPDQLFAGLAGLLSGVTAAFAYLQVMALGKLGESETRIVFYFAVGSALAGALGMAVVGVSPWQWPQALWLLPVGLLASLGQLCMTRAFSHGATLVVACLQYSGIVFGALFGLLLFGDDIPLAGWVGMALILVSGIAATALRAHADPLSPAQKH
jgi:drug/metabolite transporter (DMT)-like permease